MTDSIPTDKELQVAEALRAACRKEFGTDWCYDVALAFARAAIAIVQPPHPGLWFHEPDGTIRAPTTRDVDSPQESDTSPNEP